MSSTLNFLFVSFHINHHFETNVTISKLCPLHPQLAVVVVGFPAVPLFQSRARFCISAGHTREQLDNALGKIAEITKMLKLRYHTKFFG